MWELDYKESLVPKNWCLWTVVLEKTLGSPLDCMEIQPVHPRRDQSWIFIGRTDAEAETPILRPPDVKNWLIWKDPDAGKAWRQEVKGTTEGEMVMASPTQWTWVSVNAGSWWWTGRPGMLRFMGSQRVRHDWVDWSVSINKLSKWVSSLLNVLIGPHQKWHLLSHLSKCIWALPLTLSSSLSRHSLLCSAFLDTVSCIFLSSTSFWFPWLDCKDIHSRDFVF